MTNSLKFRSAQSLGCLPMPKDCGKAALKTLALTVGIAVLSILAAYLTGQPTIAYLGLAGSTIPLGGTFFLGGSALYGRWKLRAKEVFSPQHTKELSIVYRIFSLKSNERHSFPSLEEM